MSTHRLHLPALWKRFSIQAAEPGAAMFRGLRLRLTLLYSSVLGGALVLFCLAVYLSTQYLLFTSIDNDLAGRAHATVDQWQRQGPLQVSPPPGFCSGLNLHPGDPQQQQDNNVPLTACYDPNGTLLTNTTQLPSSFLTNTLALTALHSSSPVTDTVPSSSLGDIHRYAAVVRDPSGQVLGVIQVGEVITGQENALQTLLEVLIILGLSILVVTTLGGLLLANRALAPARLAFTRQQRFIADASHELRTPLTLLRANAEVLLRGRAHLDADDVALLEDIVAETQHMSHLANNMLDLARLDAGTQRQEHDLVHLEQIANNVVHRAQGLAKEKNIELLVESIHPAQVIGDKVLLEQATLVLLDNALKYNRPGGHVTLRTDRIDGEALLEVKDTGIGIPPEHLSHLGERFYRVDKARSREAGGTGLGLSIARHIAQLHSGKLTLTSIPQQGTTVTLILPSAHVKQSSEKYMIGRIIG